MNELPIKETLLVFVSTLSAFLLWRVQYQKEKIKHIESQLSDKKYKMYSDLIYLIFDGVLGSKIGKELSNQEITERLISAKREMFIYAPDDVFRTFTEWFLNIKEGSTEHFKTYFKLMKLIRKDMGHNKTKIELDDFMLFLMQNREEYQKFKKENNW